MDLSPPTTPYLEAGLQLQAGVPALLGVPYEGTACFRKGTASAPDAIRQHSDGLESYSPLLDRDLSEISFADLGNLNLPGQEPEEVARAVREASRELHSRNSLPLLLGGEHSFTPGAIAAALDFHPDLAVLQLDAHADLRREWTGTPWSHACAMRRVLDLLPSSRLLQCGIRSGTREEFAELRQANRLVAADAVDLADALHSFRDLPLYFTLDLDLFDPSSLPGTGTPEPGGIDWHTFETLLEVIPWPQVVACDIVELAPNLDPSGCSTVLAAKVVREVLLSLGH